MKRKINWSFLKRREWILSAAFMIAMVLAILGIDIYRKTIINPWILVGISIGGALLGFCLLWKKEATIKNSISSLITCVGIGVGSLYFLFLFLNKSFASGTVATDEFAIEKSGRTDQRSRRPYARINFHGREKELIFKPRDIDQPIENYTMIRLQYKEGLFGFPYLLKQEFVVR